MQSSCSYRTKRYVCIDWFFVFANGLECVTCILKLRSLINSVSCDKKKMMMNTYSTLNVTYIKPQQENTSKYWAIETLINNYLVKQRAFYCLNEEFVSNITGEVIFSTRSLERFRNRHLASDLLTCVKQNFSLKYKITKREQRTIETLINNFFVGRRVFYHLNE